MMNGFGQPFHLPLFHKQAVIVLREELEYFTIPPPSMKTSVLASANPNVPPPVGPEYTQLKDACGESLLMRRQIFTALQRNVNKENNLAEQHLIDMLCMSGFEPDDHWGYRAREPARCGITSTALVLLKTGVTHPSELPGGRPSNAPLPRRPIGVQRKGIDMEQGMPPLTPSESDLGEWVDDGQGGALRVNQQQLSTTQKLLLFWRKPAVRAQKLTTAKMLVGRYGYGGALRTAPHRRAQRDTCRFGRHVAARACMASTETGHARTGVGPTRMDARSQPGR